MPMPPAMKISRFGSVFAISNSLAGGSTATIVAFVDARREAQRAAAAGRFLLHRDQVAVAFGGSLQSE